jgi:hypothetical protein
MSEPTKVEGAKQGPREETQAAEDWGERAATGRTIARRGKSGGPVAGATDSSPSWVEQVVTPPAPPGESSPLGVEKTRAVANALTQLGENADPRKVAQAIKAQTGMDLVPAEVTSIRAVLRERAQTPPGPDQPPPENAQPRSQAAVPGRESHDDSHHSDRAAGA